MMENTAPKTTAFQINSTNTYVLVESPTAMAEAIKFKDNVHSWSLTKIVVKNPKERNKGIGSDVLEALKDELRKQGCWKLYAEPKNKRFPRFLEKNGFIAKSMFVKKEQKIFYIWRPLFLIWSQELPESDVVPAETQLSLAQPEIKIEDSNLPSTVQPILE
jgi:hypothetical protein